jgi:cell division protein FtsW
MISKEDFANVYPKALVERTRGDRYIWLIVILLTIFSCLAIYSSTGSLAYKYNKSNEHFLIQQLIYVAIGLGVMYFAHLLHYKYYSMFAKILLGITVVLLAYTLIFGSNLNDASRWIKIPLIGLSFQTSDLAKLTILMYTARMLSKKQEIIHDFKQAFIPIVAPIILVVGLILPANFSTASILLFTCIVLLFIGRISFKHLILLGVGGLLCLVLFIGAAKIVGYEGRIKTWENRLKSFKDDKDKGVNYQTMQANIAIAKGGITGMGPGNSTQRNFLPHPYSDFIFATIIEEYGMLGALILICIYLFLLMRCIKIYLRCPGAFGGFLAVGLGFALCIQAFMHMAVNVHLVPVTGVTLPFVSMGGTSLIFNSVAVGIILSVAKNVEEMEGQGAENPSFTLPTASSIADAPVVA